MRPTGGSLLIAAVLTIVVASSGGQPIAFGQDELPDLEVTFRGLNGQREVNLVVRNLSKEWWADETTIKVETLPPKSPNPKELFVENLDEDSGKPGKNSVTLIKYVLSEDCDGHVIRAEVKPAKNWAGLTETKLANNRLETQVCPAKGAPKPEPKPEPKPNDGLVVTGPIGGPIVSTDTGVLIRRVPGELVVAEHLQPGTHTLSFKPKELISVGRLKTHNALPDPAQGEPAGWQPVRELRDTSNLLAGWGQDEEESIVARFWSYQLLARFDLDLLDEVPVKLVSRASLTFDESPFEWSNAEGEGEDKSGCATTLGRFKFETDFNSVRGLIETEYVNDIPPGGQGTNVLRQILGREVNVTSHVLGYVTYPEFFTFQPNFVLRPELEDGDGDDSEACTSRISNVELHVTYTVLDKP